MNQAVGDSVESTDDHHAGFILTGHYVLYQLYILCLAHRTATKFQDFHGLMYGLRLRSFFVLMCSVTTTLVFNLCGDAYHSYQALSV
jgi:hypothetical protein